MKVMPERKILIQTIQTNIVNRYDRSYSDLDTLRSLYYQSNNYSLKNSISDNYRSIFKYLIQSNNNSAISNESSIFPLTPHTDNRLIID